MYLLNFVEEHNKYYIEINSYFSGHIVISYIPIIILLYRYQYQSENFVMLVVCYTYILFFYTRSDWVCKSCTLHTRHNHNINVIIIIFIISRSWASLAAFVVYKPVFWRLPLKFFDRLCGTTYKIYNIYLPIIGEGRFRRSTSRSWIAAPATKILL